MFACGTNDDGQLGVGDTDNIMMPNPLVTGLLKTKTVVQVTAGCLFSAYLTADGLVFVSGDNEYGQLGVGTQKSEKYQRWCVESCRAETCCKSLLVHLTPYA